MAEEGAEITQKDVLQAVLQNDAQRVAQLYPHVRGQTSVYFDAQSLRGHFPSFIHGEYNLLGIAMLHGTIFSHDLIIVKALLDANADPNEPSCKGHGRLITTSLPLWDMLVLVARPVSSQGLRLLLRSGADPYATIVDNGDEYALDWKIGWQCGAELQAEWYAALGEHACYRAMLALLNLRRRFGHHMTRDVLRLVAAAVWATRGDKKWEPAPLFTRPF